MSYKKIVTLNKSIVIVLSLVCIFITGCTDNNDKNGITSHGKENHQMYSQQNLQQIVKIRQMKIIEQKPPLLWIRL